MKLSMGPSQKKRAHSRHQLIYYMGKFVNDSSSSLAPLKMVIASNEFEDLLTLLSSVGAPRMIKLLESASRNCAAKKAERAEKKNARKRADAVSDRPGSTKRVRLQEVSRSSDQAKGTAYDESGGSEPLPSHSEESNIQTLSEEGQIPKSLHNRNQARRRIGVSSRISMRKAEDEDDTMVDSSPDAASLRHSGPSSHCDNNSSSSVKTECEDSASKSLKKSDNLTQNPGQFENKQIRTRKRPQSAHENGDRTTNIGTVHPSEAPTTKEKAIQQEAWDMYQREVGIIRRDPDIIAPIENYCKTLFDASNRSGNPKKEVGELLSDIEQLDFLFAKDRLIKYLNNRQAKSGMQTETPATWTMSEPQQVLGALRTIQTICDDAHIHRAFGQMKLCLLVQDKLKSGHKPISSSKGKQRLPETKYLEELARREAGPVSEDEIEASFRDYQSEYQAGKRWLQVADWFGGPGIVLVFITAGTSGSDKEDQLFLTNENLSDRNRTFPCGCWMEGVPAQLSQVHLTFALQYQRTGRRTRNRLSGEILSIWSLTSELPQECD